jgi:uncharacterized protein
MERNEQQLIDDLFRNIAEAERTSGPRDGGAERYISQLVSRQPNAAYYMTQSLILQEQALNAAQQRIEELERGFGGQPSGGGSFLGGAAAGGAMGGSVPPTGGFRYPGASDGNYQAQQQQPSRYPAPTPAPEPERGGGIGGFLSGAAQTVAGLAGGFLLGNMITGMLRGDSHHGSGEHSNDMSSYTDASPSDFDDSFDV